MPDQSRRIIRERIPGIYALGRKVYWEIRGIVERLQGTAVNENYWAKRGAEPGSDWQDGNSGNWAEEYWNSVGHPHRETLIKAISAFVPIDRVLEIGCNCGPNLRLLNRVVPQARLSGIDINEESVLLGKKLLAQEGLDGLIELSVGKADDLARFADDSFDVVFTDAILIYIGPDKIDQVAREMLRVAKKAIVLVEWGEVAGGDSKGRGQYSTGLWKRNYAALFERLAPQVRVEIERVTQEMWPDPKWQRFGHLVRVRLPPHDA